MDAHDQIGNEPDIEFDKETYEIKAIKAYIAKEISSADLQVSLELGRAQTFHRVEKYRRLGAAGLESGKNGNRNRASSELERERIIRIVREEFIDFGPTFAAEKLETNHGIFVVPETLRLWMIAEGLWTDRKGRKPKVFSPRKPREQRGELIQVGRAAHHRAEAEGRKAKWRGRVSASKSSWRRHGRDCSGRGRHGSRAVRRRVATPAAPSSCVWRQLANRPSHGWIIG